MGIDEKVLLDEEVVDEFLSTPGEVHPVWFGFCESIGIGAQVSLLTEAELKNLISEMHYCLLGMALGGVTLAGLFAVGVGIIVGLFFGSAIGILSMIAAGALYLIYWFRRVAPDIRDLFEWEVLLALANYNSQNGGTKQTPSG